MPKDNGGTYGVMSTDRVLELPGGEGTGGVAPPNRGRLRYNNDTKTWEASIDGGVYEGFAGVGHAGVQLVFDPAGVGPDGANVFTDWDKLYAAFQVTPGIVAISFPGPASIPAGDYHLEGRADLLGAIGANTQVLVSLDPGVTISEIQLLEGLDLRQTGPDASIVVPEDKALILFRNARISSSNGPLVRLDGDGAQAQIVGLFGGGVSFAGGAAPVEVPASRQGAFLSLVASIIDDDTVEGPASATFFFLASGFTQNTNPTFAGFSGTYAKVFVENADGLGYTASTPADWAGSPPAEVSEALNRLAAAVGPVP